MVHRNKPMRSAILLCSLGVVFAATGCSAYDSEQLPNFQAAADYSAAHAGVSFLVMQGGEIIFEDYPNEGGPDEAWITASGTKSFWGVLLAAMVQDGTASLDEKVADTITEWRSDPRKSQITVSQLLSMTDGLAGQGSGPGPVETYAEAVALPAVNDPGAVFHYRPAPWQVFGEWVRRKVEPDYPDAVAFLQARLLDALEVAPHDWPTEADGYPRMPSSSVWTARNWAVFAEFVRRGGVWNGTQLVDPDALQASLTAVPANPAYGLGWWLGAAVDESIDLSDAQRRLSNYLAAHPVLPDGVYMARGGGNQRIYIIPGWEMLIVRQQRIAPGAGRDFSDIELFQHLLNEI